MIKQANAKTILEAADILKSGGIVAIPTETVYGLAADATNDAAVAKVFAAKGRPSFNPLIIHVLDASAAGEYGEMNAAAQELAAAFWPGPLTLILPLNSNEICASVTAGLHSVAVRVPAHPIARQLLKASGLALAAPSANASGRLSPTTPMHVAESLGDAPDMILAAGACAVGLESTVVDVSGDVPVILRPGAITAEDLSQVLGYDIGLDNGCVDGDVKSPKSPGQLLKHYAPNTPVRLNAVDVAAGEALLAFGNTKFMGIKTGGFANELPSDSFCNLSEQGDLYEAAANLFAMLKLLDMPAHSAIAVMPIPDIGVGVAINDRLRRAAASVK